MAEQNTDLFENKILERLSRISARVAFKLYPIFIAGLFYLNYHWDLISGWNIPIFFVLGLIFWTFMEYAVHRYAYHDKNGDVVNDKNSYKYAAHGIHHEFPRDDERLIMPPLPYVVLIAGLIGISWIFMGGAAVVFIAGLALGHLGYVYVHYRIHTDNPPKFFESRKIHHLIHHYKHPNKAFGVSTFFWDRVMGTMPPKESVKNMTKKS